MDIKELKEYILEDTNNIKLILEAIGCHRITKHNNEYRCAKNSSDPNPTRVSVKINENISSRIYDLIPIKGDIFVIIMEIHKCKLSKAIELVCFLLGIKNICNYKPPTKKKAFGGFYKEIKKDYSSDVILNVYDDNILNQFQNSGNIRFYKDNIEYDIQTEFEIMYDYESNRIVVPWRNLYGNLIGVMGRYNADANFCEQYGISKWLPLPNLNFSKSQCLYGLYQNYKYILDAGSVYVFESEKSVLQTASFQIRNTVAIGSHDISPMQRKILLSLGVDIITCMDQGIPDEFNAEQCKRLKSNSSLIGGKIGFAMVNDILNNKESPSDRGLDVFNLCIAEENIFWI